MEINKTNESFLSSNGVNRISYFVYRPTENIKGILQISHGMCEHIERYQDFAMFMAQNGFVVYGHDHLGHGHSVKSKEELGYFGEDSGWKYLVEDLYQMSKIARREYPFHKLFLLGHSMGSFIARLYFMKYGKGIDGLILSGTSGGNRMLNMGLMLADIQIRLKGTRHRSDKLQKLMFGSYNRRYPEVRTDSDWISSDPAVVDAYLRDELNTFVFTNAGFRDLMTMLKMGSDDRWARTVPKNIPVFLLSGDMDPVGDYGAGVKKVYDRLLEAGAEDVKIKLYSGGRHEMLNEVNRTDVYYDILNWLLEKL